MQQWFAKENCPHTEVLTGFLNTSFALKRLMHTG